MKIDDDAVHAAEDARPEDKEGSDIATSSAAQTGTAEPASETPGDKLVNQLAGDSAAAKIDALHTKHFAGTAIAGETALWNMVHAFTQDIKRLWAELEDAVEKL